MKNGSKCRLCNNNNLSKSRTSSERQRAVKNFFQETGMITMNEPETQFNLESPGGLVKVIAECQGGQVKSVSLVSMPSFVGYTNKKVDKYVESHILPML